MNILHTLRQRFAAALAGLTPDPQPFAEMVRSAQDAKFGDFQANCAMPLAKQLGTNPRELAQQILDRLDVADLCTPPEIAGPGFINLRRSSHGRLWSTSPAQTSPSRCTSGTSAAR